MKRAYEAERVYTFIVDYWTRCGQKPTKRQIEAACGLSRYQVDHSLLYLRGAGRICERVIVPTEPYSIPDISIVSAFESC